MWGFSAAKTGNCSYRKVEDLKVSTLKVLYFDDAISKLFDLHAKSYYIWRRINTAHVETRQSMGVAASWCGDAFIQ